MGNETSSRRNKDDGQAAITRKWWRWSNSRTPKRSTAVADHQDGDVSETADDGCHPKGMVPSGDSCGRTIGVSDKFYARQGVPAFGTNADGRHEDESEKFEAATRRLLLSPSKYRWSGSHDQCCGEDMEGRRGVDVHEALLDVLGPEDDMTLPRRGILGSRPGSFEDAVQKIERSRARIVSILNGEDLEDVPEEAPALGSSLFRSRRREDSRTRKRRTPGTSTNRQEETKDNELQDNGTGRGETSTVGQEAAGSGTSSIFQCPPLPPSTTPKGRLFFGPDPPSLSAITWCQVALAQAPVLEETLASRLLRKYIYIEDDIRKWDVPILRRLVVLVSALIAVNSVSVSVCDYYAEGPGLDSLRDSIDRGRQHVFCRGMFAGRTYTVMTLSVREGDDPADRSAAGGGNAWRRYEYLGATSRVERVQVGTARITDGASTLEAFRFRKHLASLGKTSAQERVARWLEEIPEPPYPTVRLMDALSPRMRTTGALPPAWHQEPLEREPAEDRFWSEVESSGGRADMSDWDMTSPSVSSVATRKRNN
ncbi:hypothetical protein AAG570_007157 [Ranatra chinensis]|uniref:Uncharacterized protein n=1 Tax=Ranatra chinensis TaxID=642074 RepID=A0ABD0XV21_9HEMI